MADTQVEIITAIWNHPSCVDRTVADVIKRVRGDAVQVVLTSATQSADRFGSEACRRSGFKINKNDTTPAVSTRDLDPLAEDSAEQAIAAGVSMTSTATALRIIANRASGDGHASGVLTRQVRCDLGSGFLSWAGSCVTDKWCSAVGVTLVCVRLDEDACLSIRRPTTVSACRIAV